MLKLSAVLVASSALASAPALAAETITYSYDALGRLVQVTHSGTVNNGVQSSYGYDPADNRTNVTVVKPNVTVVAPVNGATDGQKMKRP
jgi:hypothetical protein